MDLFWLPFWRATEVGVGNKTHYGVSFQRGQLFNSCSQGKMDGLGSLRGF